MYFRILYILIRCYEILITEKKRVCLSRRGIIPRPVRFNRESIAVQHAFGPTSASNFENTSSYLDSENVSVPKTEPVLLKDTSAEDASGCGCTVGEKIPLNILNRSNTFLKRKETEEV